MNQKLIRAALSIALAISLVLGYFPAYATATEISGELEESADAFTPVVRFAVTSDTHIRPSSDPLNGYEQLEAFMESVYTYSEAQSYDQLDGVFFVGDNTNRGATSEQTYFFNYVNSHLKGDTVFRAVLGNHEFYANGYDYDGEAGPSEFMKYSGWDSVDFHIELDGYHIIMASMNKYASYSYFSDTKLAWMQQEIEAAIAEDPTKPIFVMQHMSPYDTMKGSTGTGSDKKLRELLDNYPQVIDFSGHTHVSLSDPRAIWQDTFTALNTGSLAYLSTPIIGVSNSAKAIDTEGGWVTGSNNQGPRNGLLYYMVEIAADNTVRILTVDMFSNEVIGEPYIIDSLDPENFKYTADRVNDAEKPVFTAEESLQIVTNNYKNAQLTIYQATCKDFVQSYRIEVYQEDTLLQTVYRSSCVNYGSSTPASINAYIKDLAPETTYTLKVYACSSWGLDSDPLTATLTTSPESSDAVADVLDVTFLADGSAVNAVTGELLEVCGAPTVSYDEELEQYVADFDGVDDAYAWWRISNWYDVIGESFTLETFVYFEATPSSAMNIVSNLQSAGMGLQYATDGNVYFWCKAGDGEYVKPAGSVAAGNWAHLAATYDGASVRFYINGELVSKADASGALTIPDYMARAVYLGADSAVNGVENFFDGKIASAKMYSSALTKTQIEALFSAGKLTFCKHCQQATSSYTEVDSTLAETWADGEALVSGHYVLQTDIDLTETLTVASGETVCIDLNGHSLSAKAACRTVKNAGTLHILNGNVTGSGAAGIDNIAQGANIYNSGILHLDSVTVSGGKSTDEAYSATSIGTSGEYGGNIYNTGSGNLTITDSIVTGGMASRGGNIYTVGTVTVNDSTVTGGHANRGGNIAVSSGTVYLNDSTVSDGLGSGRDLYCQNRTACIYISGSAISSTGSSSSIRVLYGNLIMYSGSVTADTAVISTGTATTPVSTVTVYGGNITGKWSAAYGAAIRICGGEITGDLSVADTITADASLDILGGSISGDWSCSDTTLVPVIYNGAVSGFDPSDLAADCACVQASGDGYIVWNYKHKAASCADTCVYETALTESIAPVEMTGGHTYVDDGSQWVCSGCGTANPYKDSSLCLHGCEATQWIPWDGVTLTDGGHYYLTEDITLTQQVQVTGGITVCIDLNGYTVTAPKAMRAFRLTSAGTVLNLMDSSEENTGTVRGSGFVMNPSDTDTNAHGGLIYVHTASLNVYNATLTGGMTTGERGGNIYCASGSITLDNAKVTDGQNIDGIAARGGNISIFNTGATLTVKGSQAKITGGIASRDTKAYGGNLYCSNGATIIICDGEISGGYAASDGANIELMNGKDSDGLMGHTYIYGGTIGGVHEDTPYDVNNFVVYGSASYMNDLFVYGGHIESIYDKGSYNTIQVFAGTFNFDPRTINDDSSSAVAICSCVSVENGVYTVFHTRGSGTCQNCTVNDHTQSHTYAATGTHDHSESALTCGVCGYVRATLKVTTVSLRPGDAGLYFGGDISWDETDPDILSCGLTLSTQNALPVADGSDTGSLYTTGGTSVLVSGIMKTGNETSVNAANAKQKVYCRAYLKFSDGTCLYSDVVTVDLRRVAEAIDGKLWDTLTDARREAMLQMYDTFSDVMDTWNLANMKASLI